MLENENLVAAAGPRNQMGFDRRDPAHYSVPGPLAVRVRDAFRATGVEEGSAHAMQSVFHVVLESARIERSFIPCLANPEIAMTLRVLLEEPARRVPHGGGCKARIMKKLPGCYQQLRYWTIMDLLGEA